MKNSFLVLFSLIMLFHFSSEAHGFGRFEKEPGRTVANRFEILEGSLAQSPTNGGTRCQQTASPSSQPGTETAANQFFVSPTGSATGAGSITSPWDLKTALSHPAAVKPGDTIYLRSGTYNVPAADLGFTSRLTGTAASPIKVTSYPGEWAVIDGNVSFSAVKSQTILLITGAYTWFMNFEITNSELVTRKIGVSGSNPTERRADSVDDVGNGTKIINLIIHDTGQGISSANDINNNEYYGNVIYNNGWDAPDRTHGHGAYIQSGSGPKTLEDNFFFDNFSENTQMYGSGITANRNISWIGNAFFNGDQTWWGPNIANLIVKENYTYKQIFKLGQNLDMSNTSADIENNYFMSGVFMDEFAQSVIFRNNTVWRDSNDPTVMLHVLNFWAPAKFSIENNTYYKSPASPGVGQMRVIYNGSKQWLPIIKRFNGEFAFNKVTGSQVNTYLTTRRSWQDAFRFDMNTTFIDSVPTGTKVFVRKNKYDPGRGNIIVYNWDQATSVSVDVSSILTIGDNYELRNVQDYFGDVQSGVYGGGPLSITMSGRTMARPIGYDQVATWYHNPLQQNTFPKFGAFVLIKKTSP